MDINNLKDMIWSQFGASVDMLENAIDACPDELWGGHSQQVEFWYLVYHTLFWLDFYLTESPEDFNPPTSFTLSELDPEGVLPDRVYTKTEMLNYLSHGRKKCKLTIENMSEEKAKKHYVFGTIYMNFGELLLYNMRHVQHGAAKLNLILRQKTDSSPKWVKKANS
jgi:hypothetical protein